MDIEKAQMFEAVFDQITFPITILKANIPRFTIIAMNAERKSAPGTPVDAVGRDAFDVYKSWNEGSEQQLILLKNGFIEAIKEKRQVKLPLLHFEVPMADEVTMQHYWVQSEITPILDSSGNVEYLLSVARNVTDQELSRVALAQSKEAEQRLKEELASTNEILTSTNEELTTVNEELACTNEELGDANHQLLITNEDLFQSRLNLEVLNNELEERILKRTKALSESENRFRTMFETITQMAWSVTNNAEATFFNKSWYEYTGLDFESSRGFGWQSAMHPDDLKAGIARFGEMRAGVSNGGGIENRFRRADGEYRWHVSRMLPVRNEEGEIDMWIGTATEIHELKELQQQKDDFISIASHELKTPITALKVSLQLLDRMKNRPATDMMPKLIAQSRKSIQRISTLIDDLLSVSRFQQGKLQLNKSRFKISEFLNACCNPISITGSHHIAIIGDTELELYADEHRMEQVVVNFVNNAVKYAPDSGQITISIQKAENAAMVSVIDHGPGIAKDKIPYLFNRYYRVEPSGYQNSGLGLGLYICAEIIKQHEGQIGVDSELGKGSAFWFTIPITDIK